MIYPSDKKDFLSKFEHFTKGQANLLKKEKIEEWFSTVEEKHQKIRNFLGGVRKVIPIDLEAEKIPSVDIEKIRPFYQKLLSEIPGYFLSYVVDLTQFRYTSYKFGNRTFKWGKHISTWMERNDTNPEKSKIVKNILCEIGEIWASAKIKTTTLYFNITTSPWAFTIIGRYNFDRDSCFANGGCNEGHKYVIGVHPNSYIVLISSEDGEERADNSAVLTRMWGMPNDDFTKFYTCNIYPKTPKDNGTVQECINQGFAKLLDVKKPFINKSFKANGIYFNPESGKIFSKQQIDQGEISVFLDADKFWYLRKCMRCNNYPKSDGGIVDEISVCENCIKAAWKCEWTKKITFSAKHRSYDRNGKIMSISSPPILSGEFILTNDGSDTYCHKDDIILMDGYKFSKFYKSIFTCKICQNKTVNYNEICRECSNKKDIPKYIYNKSMTIGTAGMSW